MQSDDYTGSGSHPVLSSRLPVGERTSNSLTVIELTDHTKILRLLTVILLLNFPLTRSAARKRGEK